MTGAILPDHSYPESRRDESVKHSYPSQEQGKHVEVTDYYHWLERPPNQSDEVASWAKAQSQVSEDYLSKIKDTREIIKNDISRIWSYPKMSCPNLKGDGYYYFSYNTGLQSQSPLYRVHHAHIDQADQHRELFFDPNLLSEDGTVSLGSSAFSDSGKLWAYSLCRSGSDWREFYVRKTDSPHSADQPRGRDDGRLPDVIRHVKFHGISWSKDEEGFFYSRYPAPPNSSESSSDAAGTETDANYNCKVYYHRLGTDQCEDILIAEDATSDKSELSMGVAVTDDGKYAIKVAYRDTSRKVLVDIAAVHGPIDATFKHQFIPIVTEWDADYSLFANDGPLMYFQTNRQGASNDKIVTFDVSKPEQGFKDHVPEDKNAVLCNASVRGQDKLLLIYKKDVVEHLYLYDLKSGLKIKELPVGDIGAFEQISGKRQHHTFFLTKGGYSNPSSMYRMTLDGSDASTTLFRSTQLDGINHHDYQTVQEFYHSKDGTRVPMFIFAHKDVKRDGTAPTLLYGYGGFNISIDPGFSPSFMAWVKGFKGIVAVANIRGGGEYGDTWHEAGIKEKRQNCFDDFQAAAKHLKQSKWAGPIVSSGGSNGGALVAACANQAPELFDAMIPEVGVLDMLRYHNFTIGFLWASDYGRADEDGFDYLYKWSPLHNIPTNHSKYPATLICTGEYDDRVSPGPHSFKYAAALQHALPQNPSPLLLRVELKAGHGAGKSTEQRIATAADKWAFVSAALGLRWHST